VNKYAYTPFGEITEWSGNVVTQPFKYVGQYGVMAEPNGLGLNYMRARYYDPSIGRFISEDPAGFGGGDVNLYAYVGNNPVLMVDPSGLWATPLHGVFGGLDDNTSTSPYNPSATNLHFRTDRETIENELDNAIIAGDRQSFESLMHQGQDSFAPAHQNGPIMHVIYSIIGFFTGNPDLDTTYPKEYTETQAWTNSYVDFWNQTWPGKQY
jgi:RHS repeat-associated protein